MPSLKGDGPHSGIVPEDGHPYAPPDLSVLMSVFLQSGIVIKLFTPFFHTLSEAVIVIDIFRKVILKAFGHHILHTELVGRDPHRARHVFRVALHSEHCLRDPVASHGSRHRLVRKYGICIRLDIRAGI